MDQDARQDLIHHFEKLALIVVILFAIYRLHLTPDQVKEVTQAVGGSVAVVRS